jgi:hypothetical protein
VNSVLQAVRNVTSGSRKAEPFRPLMACLADPRLAIVAHPCVFRRQGEGRDGWSPGLLVAFGEVL